MKWNDQLELLGVPVDLLRYTVPVRRTGHNWVEMKGKCFQFEECEDLTGTTAAGGGDGVLLPSSPSSPAFLPSGFLWIWMNQI